MLDRLIAIDLAGVPDLEAGLATAAAGVTGLALAPAQVLAGDTGGAAALQRRLAQRSLRLLACGPFEPVTFRMPRDFRALLQQTDRLCTQLALLDCDLLLVYGGVRPYVAEAAVRQETVEVLQRLAEVARPYGVRLALGYREGRRAAIATLGQAVSILDELGEPAVGLVVEAGDLSAGLDVERLFVRRAGAPPPAAPDGWRGLTILPRPS